MSQEDEADPYQAWLEEVFQACDSDGKGFLTTLEFECLCQQLQLQPHRHRLYTELGLDRASIQGQVFFEDFQAVLLSLLKELGLDSGTGNPHPNSHTAGIKDTLTTGDAWTGHKDQDGGSRTRFSEHNELRLDLPPITVADEEGEEEGGCTGFRDEQGGQEIMSPISPLKRAHVQDEGEGRSEEVKHQRLYCSPGDVQIFETDGLVTSSPIPASLGDGGKGDDDGDDHDDVGALNSDSGLEQLRQVCSRLGVGCHGYLTQQELEQMCQYFGMEQMEPKELQELFRKLDTDKDGFISFTEFMEGLARHAITLCSLDAPHDLDPLTPATPALRPQSGRKLRTPLPPAHHDQQASPAMVGSRECVELFSSLRHNSGASGVVRGEEVLDFWDQLNVPQGNQLLMSLGFDCQSRISLKDLSLALTQEWTVQASDDSSCLPHAMTATCLQEINHLRWCLEQTEEEHRKLRSDLAQALARNADMAAEMDEGYAQLEKSHEEQLRSQEQAHLEEVRRLQCQVEKAQETLSSQSSLLANTSQRVQDLLQQVATLQQKLAQADTDLAHSQQEVEAAQEREKEWEGLYRQMHRELQQLQQQGQPLSPHSVAFQREKWAAEEKAQQFAIKNKELRDNNDELLARLEQLQQQTSVSGALPQVTAGTPTSSSLPLIPVGTRASSVSSDGADTSEWEDDDLMSSTEAMYYRQQTLTIAAEAASHQSPSLHTEMKQQQRQRRGERREREMKEIEHAYRVEIAELEDQHARDTEKLRHDLEKDKVRLHEEYEGRLTQRLAEQQRELHNAFALEKDDLLQQYETRRNLDLLQHQHTVQLLQNRLNRASPASPQKDQDPVQEIAVNLQTCSRLQELERQLQEAQAQHEKDLQVLSDEQKAWQQELRADHEKQLQALNSERETELQVLKNDNEKQLQELRTKHERDLQELSAEYERDLQELSAKHERDLQELSAQHERDLQELRTQYERDLQELRTQHESDLQKIHNSHEGQLVDWTHATQNKIRSKTVDSTEQTKLLQEVDTMRCDSPLHTCHQQESLEQVQGQISQLHHQLSEARIAQLEYQQLKEKCELLRQTNGSLEDMVRALRQRCNEEHSERDRQQQVERQELWQEKKTQQDLLHTTTDRLLRSSAEMAASHTQLLRHVEQLRLRAGNVLHQDTLSALQVSLLENQRHTISVQEALMQRTQLSDTIMAETEKERQQERELWEEQKRELQTHVETTTEMYRTLAAQHKSLRQSATKMAAQLKEVYVENADLMQALQETEAKHITAQRMIRKLQHQCQAWHDAVHHMLHSKAQDSGHVAVR